jgi:hypothetical protein
MSNLHVVSLSVFIRFVHWHDLVLCYSRLCIYAGVLFSNLVFACHRKAEVHVYDETHFTSHTPGPIHTMFYQKQYLSVFVRRSGLLILYRINVLGHIGLLLLYCSSISSTATIPTDNKKAGSFRAALNDRGAHAGQPGLARTPIRDNLE